MGCRSFIPRNHRRNRPWPGQVECENCTGDGVVNGTCSCGRCESPPDECCPVCDGTGYVDAPDEDETGNEEDQP